MHQRIPRCVVAVAGLLASISLSQAQTTINFISGGTAAKKILIISNTASGTTSGAYKDWKNLEAARNDLAATLTLITSQTFTTGTFTGSSGMVSGAIILGRASDLNLSGSLPSTNPKDNERFVIATANSGSNLVIAGVTNNGAVAGTYELLEQLGCRWYFTNSKWSNIPTDASLSWTSPATVLWSATANMGGASQALSVYQDEKPDYVARWIVPLFYGPTGGNHPHKEWLQQWDDLVAWNRRNRNVKGVNINDYHNFANIVKWAKEDATSSDPTTDPPYSRWKPEYYSCISGSRVADPSAPALAQTKYYQLCAGNPEVLQLCKDYTDWYFTQSANDTQISVSMEPQDDTLFCDVTCTWCSNTAYLPTGHNHTDKTLRIANAVAEHMETAWPGKYVGLLAYSSHANIPINATDASVHDSIFVSVATGYLFFGKSPEQLLAEWGPLTPNLGVYDYFSNFTWDMGLPNRSDGSDLHYIATAIPAWHDLHVENYVAQTSMSDAILGLGHYLGMKVLWDTDADLQAIRDEFITNMFGDASGPMDEFFKRIDKGNHYNLSEDLIGRLFRYLDEAYTDNAAGSNDPKVEARLDDLVLWLRSCELRRAWEATAGSSRTIRTQSASAALVHAWKMRSTNMLDTLSLGSIKSVWSDSYPGAAYDDALVWPLNTGTYPIYTGTSGVYYQLQANTYEKNWDIPMTASSATTRVTLITTTGTYPAITPTGTYPLTWVQLYPEGHPWKQSGTYSHSDILTMVSNGIANNDLLPVEPKTFGTDFVMSPFAGVPTASGTHRGNHTGNPKGLTSYYMFTDSNGDTPPITLTAGKIGNLNKGNLDYALYPASGGIVPISSGSIINTATAGPLITETLVFTNSQFGLQPNTAYLLTCDDHGSYSSGTWAYSANISVTANSEYPMTRSGAPNHRYFYVPKDTTHVLIAASALNGTGTTGSAIFWPSSTNFSGTVWGGGTYISSATPNTIAIPVPAGTDDRIWDARTMSGNAIAFLNVPGQLAPTPQQLVIPKDAIDYLVTSTFSSTWGRGDPDIAYDGKNAYYLRATSGIFPTIDVTSYGADGVWTLLNEDGSSTGQSGTLTTSMQTTITYTPSSTANTYILLYEDPAGQMSEIDWAPGDKVSVAANSKYSHHLGAQSGRWYFFVPKGTTTVNYSTSMTFGGTFYSADGTVKHVQADTHSDPDPAVAASIPVAGADDQVWYMNGQIAHLNFRFTNIPGHMARRPDELLLPRWTFLD